MLSFDLSSETDFTPVLALIRRWSLALTAVQQAELQHKIREGISADAQVAMRTAFREQNAYVIVDQFLEMIKIPELKHFLQHEQQATLIVNRMREILECNCHLLSQKMEHIKQAHADLLDSLLHPIFDR